MSGKLSSFLEKQARNRVQSDCKPSGIRRSPFTDITNDMLDNRLGRYNEPSSPPPRSLTLSEMAIEKENGAKVSQSGESHNCLAESAAPLRNRRSLPPSAPPLTAHTDLPSPLQTTCNDSPVKADPDIPSSPPLSLLTHLTPDS